MKELSDTDKLFCETFIKTFNIDTACTESSSNIAEMAVRLADETDFVNIYIRNAVDTRRLANTFITNDVIKNELMTILMTQDVKYKISASKLLLELEDSPDKKKEFNDLINAITKRG